MMLASLRLRLTHQSSAFLRGFMMFAGVLSANSVQAHDDSDTTDLRPVAVQRAANKSFMTLGFENDIFFGTDRHYTSGVRFGYASKEGEPLWGLGKLAKVLPFVAPSDKLRSQHSLSQYMYTPDDIEIADPPRTSRPYAGLLALDTTLIAQADDHMDMIGFSIGVTGGPSLAQASQIGLHSLLSSSPRPLGWETQVDFEVTAQVRYDRIYFIGDYESDGWQWDFQPRFGAEVGTAFINGYIGGQVRFGNRLYKEAGAALNRPGKPGTDFYAIPDANELDFHVFAGVDGRAVARDFSLDGGLRSFDRDVPREDFVFDVTAGAVVTTSFGRFSFTAVRRSKTFVTQPEADWLGALYLSFPL